jgi:GT2 family glycosyltransferase
MELSIVIVNYNTREFLRACLASLQACTLEREVICGGQRLSETVA